ncbi:MAG: hypothetical protein FD127_4371, partial [Acidimicrobiaceae bacterium]
ERIFRSGSDTVPQSCAAAAVTPMVVPVVTVRTGSAMDVSVVVPIASATGWFVMDPRSARFAGGEIPRWYEPAAMFGNTAIPSAPAVTVGDATPPPGKLIPTNAPLTDWLR